MDYENDFESGQENNQQNQEVQQIPDYEATDDHTKNQNMASSEQPVQQNYAQQSQQQERKDLGACGFLKIEYYQPFFNVTSEEVKRRVMTALIPKKPDFFEISRSNPDLWGPFWIYTSLIFIISAVGNIQGFFSAELKEHFSFDYSYVPLGAILVYTIGFGTPLLITIFMKCFGNQITAFQTICMYGYSMAVYVPVLLLCVIPYDWVQWLVISLGTGISIAFMIINLQAEFATYEQNKKYMMFGIIIGVQILFLLFLKLYFLKNFYNPDVTHKDQLEKTGKVGDENDETRFLRLLF